jgi:hypothetical protein
VFLMPRVDFPAGYFELANCLDTAKPRESQSVVRVAAEESS